MYKDTGLARQGIYGSSNAKRLYMRGGIRDRLQRRNVQMLPGHVGMMLGKPKFT